MELAMTQEHGVWLEEIALWKREAHALFDVSIDEYLDREKVSWYRAQLNFAVTALAGCKGRVLDLGCAAGVEIAALRIAGFTVVGTDFVQQMLLAARPLMDRDRGVSLTQADAEFLPFRSGSFDYVVCLGLLEYLPTYERALGEIHRVLRPDGIVIISLPSRISLHSISDLAMNTLLAPRRVFNRRVRDRVGPTVPHHRNPCIPGHFLSQLSGWGLEPLDYARTAFLFAPLRYRPAMQERFAASLERFGRSRALGWMGSQFLVSAKKAFPRTQRESSKRSDNHGRQCPVGCWN
jgi:SAM-dependent methyltransferase